MIAILNRACCYSVGGKMLSVAIFKILWIEFENSHCGSRNRDLMTTASCFTFRCSEYEIACVARS